MCAIDICSHSFGSILSYESMQSSNGTPGSQLREVIVNRRTEESTLEDFAICGGRGNSVFISALPPWMAEEGLAVGDRMVYVSLIYHCLCNL